MACLVPSARGQDRPGIYALWRRVIAESVQLQCSDTAGFPPICDTPWRESQMPVAGFEDAAWRVDNPHSMTGVPWPKTIQVSTSLEAI
jgi:hypothetical protein